MKKEEFKDSVKDFAVKTLAKFFPKEEIKLAEELLDDAVTVISYDAEVLATGVMVSVVDTQGTLMPMPAGSYTTEGGTTFDVVDDMGTADNVVLAEAPEAEAPSEVAPAAPEEQASAPAAATAPVKRLVETVIKESNFKDIEKEVVAEVVAEVKEVVEEVVEVEMSAEKVAFEKEVAELKAKADKQEAIILELKKALEFISAEPKVEPVETKRNSFKRIDAKAQRIAFKEDLEKLYK